MNQFSVIIEDDCKVCYAYLLENDEIISDVWLYNTEVSPAKINWNNPDDMPFLNPIEYIDETQIISPIQNEDEIILQWVSAEDELKEVNILVRNKLVAKMAPGFKPGWSSTVIKNGPLALKMV